MIKGFFKCVGCILLALIPIVMLILMISMQVSRHRFDNMLLQMQSQIKQNPTNMPNNHFLNQFKNHPNKPIRILVMNGGGIHGIVQLQVLHYLEKKTGKSINQLFDAVGCTSTGCLNLGILLTPNPQNIAQPAFTPEHIIQQYPQLAAKIFYSPWYHEIESLDGILKPAYSSTVKGLLLAQYMRNTTIRELLLPAYICSTQLSTLFDRCFNTWQNDYGNYQAANIINAASSPPAVFYPVTIHAHTARNNSINAMHVTGSLNDIYTDGVLVANDPSLQMVLFILAKYPNNPIVIVNIGTAFGTYALTKNSLKWSPITWVLNAVNIMFQSRMNHMSQGLEYLVKAKPKQIQYYFIDSTKTNNVPYLSGSAKAVAEASQLGIDMIKQNESQLQQVMKVLKTN